MGVAGLLRTVIEKYPNTILPAPNPNIKVDYLYLDFNAFIYHAIRLFPSNKYNFSKNSEIKKYEKKLVKLIIDETIQLVNKVVKPSKLVYIAIDGPAPLAKMVQQRERRYKRILVEQIVKEYEPNKLISGISYDTNRVTPGTTLMALLNEEFEKAISKKKFKNISVIFDGSNIPGEAEHKYLKILDGLVDDPKENHVVFSADGDVIFLSLKYPGKKIYIMQGVAASHALSKFYKETQDYAYLDVSKLGESYYNLYGKMQIGGNLSRNERKLLNVLGKGVGCKLENKVDEMREFLVDFIFLSFLEGNDFLKPIYFIKFNQDKMRTLLGIYKYQRRIRNDCNYRLINRDMTINFRFLLAIFRRLGDIEMEKIGEIKDNIERKMSKQPNRRNNDSFEDKFYYEQDNYLYKEFVKQFDFVFGDLSNFKKRYYEYFFPKKDKKQIIKDYLKTLLFNLNYYFGISKSWVVHYNEAAAPLPSDIADFLESNVEYFDKLRLEIGEPVHPFILLAYVLPPQSMTEGTIPFSYRDKLLGNYGEYFPERVDLRLLQPGFKLIHAEPHLENPPIGLLEEELGKVKLTKLERERNELLGEPMVLIGK